MKDLNEGIMEKELKKYYKAAFGKMRTEIDHQTCGRITLRELETVLEWVIDNNPMFYSEIEDYYDDFLCAFGVPVEIVGFVTQRIATFEIANTMQYIIDTREDTYFKGNEVTLENLTVFHECLMVMRDSLSFNGHIVGDAIGMDLKEIQEIVECDTSKYEDYFFKIRFTKQDRLNIFDLECIEENIIRALKNESTYTPQDFYRSICFGTWNISEEFCEKHYGSFIEDFFAKVTREFECDLKTLS